MLYLVFLSLLVGSNCFLIDNFDLASPEVFDPVFYANNHPELHLHTIEQAKQHWIGHGIAAGLRGSVQFHSKQYIERYADLQKAFGTNYKQAIYHYLRLHGTEHRTGLIFTNNHEYDGRWTILKNGIYLSASRRTGGAIDSMSWNNKEFINSRDHGRQMQMACNTNKYTECFNPTEAGGRCDADGATTHTHIDYIHVDDHVLRSQAHPAFWKPVEPVSGTQHNCSYGKICPIHHGFQTRYSYPFSKRITVGSHGVPNCIEFISNFTIAGNWPQDTLYIQMEAPAVYLTYEFTKAYSLNPKTNSAEPYHSTQLPVILSTADNQHALGGYAPTGQNMDRPVTYSHHYFSLSSFADTTGKFNFVFYKKPHGTADIHHYVYRTYMCVGTLNMVTDCLQKIMTAVPR